MLKASGLTNWTTIRPAITYSQRRFRLTILEANLLIHRAKAGKTVLLPEEAMNVQATMSWAGDVAHMISRLVLNEAALCETYSVCTAEHHTWGKVAEYYRDLIGLKYVTVPKEDFINCLATPDYVKPITYQLIYDRLFDRIMDNTKILTATG